MNNTRDVDDMNYLESILKEKYPDAKIDVHIMSNISIGYSVKHPNGGVSTGRCFRSSMDIVRTLRW